jgi:intracellular septation protein
MNKIETGVSGRTREQRPSPRLKIAVEMGPLILFFIANARPKLFAPMVAPFLPAQILNGSNGGLFTATLVLMAAVAAALCVSFAATRKLPAVPLVTAMLVLVFGLPVIFDNAMALTERGWRLLTFRWAGFFFALAVLNEIIWRMQSNDTWVAFKFPGIFILILLFSVAQLPLISRHGLSEEEAEQAPDHY